MPNYAEYKEIFIKTCKKILKKEISTKECTLVIYKNDIIDDYNNIIKYLEITYNNLNVEEKEYVDKELIYLKSKLVKCLVALNINYNFKDEKFEIIDINIDVNSSNTKSNTINEKVEIIDINIDNNSSNTKSDTINEKFEIIEINNKVNLSDTKTDTKMTLTNIEFQSYAGRIIPEYDGSPAELTRFVDALELVEENVTTFEATAIKLIKTKLKGEARNLITNEGSIQAIIATLKSNIKIESTEMVVAKLMNTKSHNKNANNYVKELEDLGSQLKRAFISEGVTLSMAEKYTTQNVVASIKANTPSNEIKTVFTAATVNTVGEALTKYSQITAEKEKNSSVLHFSGYKKYNKRNFRGGHNQNNRQNRYKGNNSNYNSNYNYNSNNNSNYNSRGSRQYNNGRNFRNNNNRGRSSVHTVQGNVQGLQMDQEYNVHLEKEN